MKQNSLHHDILPEEQVRLLNLPKIIDPRGNLTVAEQQHEVPFNVSRVYWTYDVPSGESRGGHAHKKCEEMIVAVSGSFDVTVDNGTMVQTFHLNHPYLLELFALCWLLIFLMRMTTYVNMMIFRGMLNV